MEEGGEPPRAAGAPPCTRSRPGTPTLVGGSGSRAAAILASGGESGSGGNSSGSRGHDPVVTDRRFFGVMAGSQADELPADARRIASDDASSTVEHARGNDDADASDTEDAAARAVFRQRPLPPQERLIGQGMSASEADRAQVEWHQRQVLAQNFERWVIIFSLMLCLMLPAMLGLFIWLLISFARENAISCDVPLRTWVVVVCTNVLYNTNVCGVGSLHTLIVRHVLRYDSSRDARDAARPSPWYVKAYNVLVTLGIFVWHCIGLHWVRISNTCPDASPELYQSVKVFAAFSIVFNIFVYINTVGLYTIMVFMLRNGMIHSDNAAPAGTLDQQKVVSYDPEAFKDHPECCICMADFDSSTEIRRTFCGHVFHGKCLANWLKVSRTCPLCRKDLSEDDKIPSDVIGSAPD